MKTCVLLKQFLLLFSVACMFILLKQWIKPNSVETYVGSQTIIRKKNVEIFNSTDVLGNLEENIDVHNSGVIIYDRMNDEYEEFLMTAERMELRRKYLKETCMALDLDKRGDDNLHKPSAWEFLVNYKYHLIWCNVFKSASTSWMYNFLILAGYDSQFLDETKSVLLNLAREKYPRPSIDELTEALNNSVSFLIVRHPLERLLSTYREKLEGRPFNYLRRLGSEIVLKYRYKIKNSLRPKDVAGPTFPEFVEYLLDTFQRKLKLDMHWMPIVEFCTPCMWDFKVIAHTETLEEDQRYLIKLAKLEKVLKPQWKNANREATSQKDIIQKYYSQISKSKIEQLYNIFRYDFELFNYTLDGYLEYGREEE